jgi:uncharacterized protein DUF4258
MGVTLPPELDGFLGMLGVPWPNIDEDEIRKDAAAWRTVQAGAEPARAEADAAVRGTRQVYRGESATALAEHWGRVGGDGGHAAQATAAARMAPVALEGTAGVVSAVKVAVGTQAAAGLTSVMQALAVGGALGVTAATARMYLARHAMTKVLREGTSGTGKVLAPALARRVTDPMRRILDDLSLPGARSALAGGRLPATPAGPRVPDGMAAMARGRSRRGRDRDDFTSRHARERKEQRGISQADINETISKGSKKPGKTPGTTEYRHGDIVVIRNNETFKIVTVIRK